ncbi:MAG TPA: hypothetical protein VHE35_00175 [Kofleriaceae bacterium]|nr:hypothetical protein [Kofleriaceae bacterium]
MTRTFTLALLVLAIGCRSNADEPAAAPPPAPPRVTPPAPGPPGPMPIDSGLPGAPVVPPLREHMDEHFGAATRLEQAIVRGELDDARDAATYLATHAEHPELDDWQPYVEQMQAAAGRVKAAPDLASAAALVGDVGLQCSSCHSVRAAIVTFPWEPVPDTDATVATRMRRHQWAAARLWEGLIGPSDDLWELGAEVMADNELESLVTARMALDHDARDLISSVQLLARKAPSATTAEARASLYDDLLPVCAGCHQLVRDRATPGGPP